MEAEIYSLNQDQAARSLEELYINLLKPSKVANKIYNADKKYLYQLAWTVT